LLQHDIFDSPRPLSNRTAVPTGMLQVGEDPAEQPRLQSPQRRLRGASPGVPTSMHGSRTTDESLMDVGQLEIFGPPARRKRMPSPRDKPRTKTWSAIESSGGDDNRQTSILSRSASAIATTCAAAAAAPPSDDGSMLAIFGTPRRQLSAGLRKERRPGAFCWSSAPDTTNNRVQWPEAKSNRLARSGSPVRDQLKTRSALNGECIVHSQLTRDKFGDAPDSSFGATQMDIFGSPRRQNIGAQTRPLPSPAERRNGSPAARTWRWLMPEAPVAPAGNFLRWTSN
jgi:hypothetical protein